MIAIGLAVSGVGLCNVSKAVSAGFLEGLDLARPDESRGLDQSLRELAEASHGPWRLRLLAVGLALFGTDRVLDAAYRNPPRSPTAEP